ncbi:MAG: PHP domain-containing protein [Bacteroidales bacterium]|nr:PHP domain-containing protein [Bacteroidales bacterium]MCF8391542.1 PHP domain-containing protein [Bacteroidales bacterium]
MDFWNQFPEKEQLLDKKPANTTIYKVNGHVHTPYSFSAFNSIEQAFKMAKEEDVKVLGINDFFTTAGYNEWAENCQKNKVFPLFNIEFIGLSKIEQDAGVRINDPNNPGRIYLSGKGLSFPFKLDEPYASRLRTVNEKSNEQSQAMCELLNKHLLKVEVEIQLSYSEILENLTEGMVRERHLAKALRMAVLEKETTESGKKEMFERIFDGKLLKSDLSNIAGLENEIRANLLKSGGPAFIEESPDFFLDIKTVQQLIIKAGGIPTYPLLADSVNGGYTEFEENKERLYADLLSKGLYSIEFVSNRNTTESLEEYAKFFTEKGFIITYGSEHNTPELIPLTLTNKSGEELTDYLKEVNFSGACIIAAHQYLFAKTGEGYLNSNGEPKLMQKDEFEILGRNLLEYFYTNKVQ